MDTVAPNLMLIGREKAGALVPPGHWKLKIQARKWDLGQTSLK